MSKTSGFIVRAVGANGGVAYYTGRAGAGWLSSSAADAFTYETLEGARHRAALVNRMTALHGFHATAQPVNGRCEECGRPSATRLTSRSWATGDPQKGGGICECCLAAYRETVGLSR